MSDESLNPQKDSGRVGYGKPPESTRFRKGRSGNPKGRPKGSLNVASVLAATLRERVVVNESGQRKTITKLEAAIKQLVNKAASGDLRALQQLVALARDAEHRDPATTSPQGAIGELDQKVIANVLRRFQSDTESEGLEDKSDAPITR